MRLTWYGHSCFMLESRCGSVVFDPYEDDYVPGLRLPPLSADLVLFSHNHGDHNAVGKIALSGFEPECDTEQLFTWHDDVQGAKRGPNIINIVSMEGFRVVHLGDLGHELTAGQIRAMGHVSALLIPVGGYYTIDAAAARRIADAVGADVTIPMHYRGEDFGFDVIDTVDSFAALSSNAEYASGPVLELKRGGEPKTLILKRA